MRLMTSQEAEAAVMRYFDRVHRQQRLKELRALRDSDDPWKQAQFDLWGRKSLSELEDGR